MVKVLQISGMKNILQHYPEYEFGFDIEFLQEVFGK